MSDTTNPRTFEEAEAVLAETLPGYESRPQQQTLARAVERSFATGQHLIGQAGCGTGKSLGYLIPAIQANGNTVITTATKALQDQIANKDLPFLAEHLGIDFTYTVLKGRSNYVCRAKLDEADTDATREVKVAIRAKKEAGETFYGERDELPVPLTDMEWRGITASSDECPGKSDCPYGEECFAEQVKERARNSKIVVVNHALFFTDLMVREVTGGKSTMIGEYDVVVADEAHELEDWAAKMLGTKFTEGGIRKLTSEANNFAQRHLEGTDKSDLTDAIADLLDQTDRAWEMLEEIRPQPRDDDGSPLPKPNQWRLRRAAFDNPDWEPTWIAFHNALVIFAQAIARADVTGVVGADKARLTKQRLGSRSTSLAKKFRHLLSEMTSDDPKLVAWCEATRPTRRGRQADEQISIEVAPIEVADILYESVWSKTPAILVSATMSVGGKFDYITGRLGIPEYEAVDVGTPFDYGTQSAIYVPSHLSSPKARSWAGEAIVEMGDLVRASQGRALLLFTSRKQMESAYETLSRRLPYVCMMQGQAPNNELADKFMADHESVLFATRSFFTGVDFQGSACSLVVIDKMPFPVPTEPVTEARCERIEARGGSSFTDYVIPVMSLILEQGFGRLIRHRNDRGVVAILDSRLTETPYGKGILRSLPPAKRISAMHEVDAFFGGDL